MKEIQLSTGIRLTRQLVSAYADVMLRRKGKLSRLVEPKQTGRRGRPWTDAEYDEGKAMRLRGLTDMQIANRLQRSIGSVQRAIGYGMTARGRYAHRTGAAA